MRWLKHLSMAHADDKIGIILEEFGGEGYGVWWLILENISAPMEAGKMLPAATHSTVKWAQICHCSTRRFRSIALRMAEINLINLHSTSNGPPSDSQSTPERLEIEVPNILKYKDEYSKKSGQTPSLARARSDRKQIESRERAEGEENPAEAPPEPASQKPEETPQVPANLREFPPPPGDDWFEEMYSRHPKKKDRGLAQSLLAEACGGPAFDRGEFDRVHKLWCFEWASDKPQFAPTLAQWILDKGWRYPPKERDPTPAQKPFRTPREQAMYDEMMRD